MTTQATTHQELFADIDSMDPERLAAHLAQDVTFRFGNAEPIRGREAVRDAWAAFGKELRGVRHDVVARWTVEEVTIVEATVTYTRRDYSQVTLPVVTIYRERDGLINDYRIYIDLAPLFADDTGGAE
jgi:ketosteroid isomerase-like protein